MSRSFDRFKTDYQHQKVLIFGLGLLGAGVACVKRFADIGCDVRATDIKTEAQLADSLSLLKGIPVKFTLGKHELQDIEWADVVVRNPAVPQNHPLILKAKKLGKRVVMETALAAQYATMPIVGITGTRGKSTTTNMITTILRQCGHYDSVLLGGNQPGDASLSLLSQMDESKKQILIMELSSWQLQGFKELALSPHVAVITNLYPDHLNYYASFADYIEDKRAIYTAQSPQDHLILNTHQPEFHQWADEAKSQVHWYSPENLPAGFHLLLLGEHNRENAAAAIAAAATLGIAPDQSLSILKDFRSLPFRLESVGRVGECVIYNDTTSTTPVATVKAIKSVTRPVVLICGGSDKKLPVDALAETINLLVDRVILLSGNGTDRLKPLLHSHVIAAETNNLEQAYKAALSYTSKAKSLLFSPGFTSFGLFKNEFDRGEQFNRILQTSV